jgi:G:T/U-mismatch repair DNA glycosylase
MIWHWRGRRASADRFGGCLASIEKAFQNPGQGQQRGAEDKRQNAKVIDQHHRKGWSDGVQAGQRRAGSDDEASDAQQAEDQAELNHGPRGTLHASEAF